MCVYEGYNKARDCRQQTLVKYEVHRYMNTNEWINAAEIETNCRETPKISDLDEFLDLDRDFLVWTLLSRRNRDISISIKISRLSRLTF
jgi:hypothetical protein